MDDIRHWVGPGFDLVGLSRCGISNILFGITAELKTAEHWQRGAVVVASVK
jgi:hypothetical protein